MKTLTALLVAGTVLASTGAAFALPPGPPPPHHPGPPMHHWSGFPHPGPGFGFGFGFGFAPPPPPIYYYPQQYCLSLGQVYQSLADDGFYRARLVEQGYRHLTIDAVSRGRTYQLYVDRCSGNILDETPLR